MAPLQQQRDEESLVLIPKEDAAEATPAVTSSRKKWLTLALAVGAGLGTVAVVGSSRSEKAGNSSGAKSAVADTKAAQLSATMSSTADDDPDTVVAVMARDYFSEEACEENGTGVMGTFSEFSFITGKCSAYTTYDNDDESGKEGIYYMATCEDDILTVTSYATDSTCTTPDGDEQTYGSNEDQCVADESGATTRYYVSSCDGTTDEKILAEWKAYHDEHSKKDEMDLLIEQLDKRGHLYDQKAKKMGLIPSKRAIVQALKMKKKLEDTTLTGPDGTRKSTLHPALKRMTQSPHAWELILRTHEGTKAARALFKSEKPAQDADMARVQEAFKKTMSAIELERLDMEKKGVVDKHSVGNPQWFWDDWFADDGDDIVENLTDDIGIENWDDGEYDAMPAITLHVGVSTQIFWVVGEITVDIAINTDLMYSVGATIASGTTSGWAFASIDYTSSCTFMFNICKNPGQAVSYGLSAGVSFGGYNMEMTVGTVWAYDPYELLGIDFAFATGLSFDVGFSIDVSLMWATTDMYFNSRDMRSYCDPNTYLGDVTKEAPWTLTTWDDDMWGWDE
jgi:hypothetical protein